jgi:hypothetical protein
MTGSVRVPTSVLVATGFVLVAGFLALTTRAGMTAEDLSPSVEGDEVLRLLGDGVVGPPESFRPMSDPVRVARLEPGEWTYRMTAGTRRGQTERENLASIGTTTRGETWQRTIGQEYTLYLQQTGDGHLLLPSEIAHAHSALVQFEPPLTYLLAGLLPGERRGFDGRIVVYSSRDPASKLYTGRIQATTAYVGSYQVRTPAGAFSATLISTDYRIDILAVVSVRDRLYTFYADGVGKVAEAEHRRMSAVGLIRTDMYMGKVLTSFTPQTSPARVESP